MKLTSRPGQPSLDAFEVAPAQEPAFAAAHFGPKPRAVFVVHGMGSQIPFETLDQVAQGLVAEERRVDPGAEILHVANQKGSGEAKVRRLELKISPSNGKPAREVHVYESYWAPVTEGRVTLRDTISFLVSGALNGVKNASEPSARWLFGKMRPLPEEKRRATQRQLWLAAGVMGGLFLVAALSGAAWAASLGKKSWVTPSLLSDLTWSAITILVPCMILAICILASSRIKRRHREKIHAQATNGKKRPSIDERFTPPSARVLDGVGWGAFRVACAAILANLLVIPAYFLVYSLPRGNFVLHLSSGNRFVLQVLPTGWGGPVLPQLHGSIELAAWALLIGVLGFSRHFLIQYVGDVAAYVSTHKLDRFDEIRDEIKKRAKQVLRSVYEVEDAYERVYVVGHSLGSVVAYNVLNDLLNDDLRSEEKLRVRDRTKLLLTFGSPLDKLAFIFATQSKKTSEDREALAALVQPLIQTYGNRTMEWVNVFSPRDIISGSLEAYDFNPGPNDKPIENIEDTYARTPLKAHVEYWQTPPVWQALRQRLIAD